VEPARAVLPSTVSIAPENLHSKQVQASLLEAFGIAADTKFLKGKAIGSV